MTQVFYFPRYSQRENFITNNTLLLLYRLYDSNRRRFQRFLTSLLDEAADAPIDDFGLRISQQVGTANSVLDAFLYQSHLRIGIETKRGGVDFDIGQLIRHLDAFENVNSGYLILLRPARVNLSLPEWDELRLRAQQKNVLLASVTFEEVIESFRGCLLEHDEELHELIDDFEGFCSEERLLNKDQVTILVPPCGQSFDINVAHLLYFCPAERPLRRVRYLGIYKQKTIEQLGTISHVIYADVAEDGRLISQDVAGEPIQLPVDYENRIRGAIAAARNQNGWDISHGCQFVLCNELVATHYRKRSRGGIMARRYLDIGEIATAGLSLGDIAQALCQKTWE